MDEREKKRRQIRQLIAIEDCVATYSVKDGKIVEPVVPTDEDRAWAKKTREQLEKELENEKI